MVSLSAGVCGRVLAGGRGEEGSAKDGASDLKILDMLANFIALTHPTLSNSAT